MDRVWLWVEGKRLAVVDFVLPHPSAMGLKDLNYDLRVLLSPSPHEPFQVSEFFDVVEQPITELNRTLINVNF